MASSLATSKRPTDSVFLDGVPTVPDIQPPSQGGKLPEGLTEVERLDHPIVSTNSNSVVNLAGHVTENAADPLCPKCRWRLIDPATMGYCPKCGFCRYIEVQRLSSSHINLGSRNTSFLG